MCILDIILGICLILAVIQGIIKGFTEQAIALVSIFIGTWAAFRFTELVCGFLQPYMHVNERALNVLVFILMILLVIVIFRLIGKVIKASINFALLGWLDRLLGALFGLLKVALILGIIIILFDTFNSAFSLVSESVFDNSIIYPPLRRIAYGIFPYFKELMFK